MILEFSVTNYLSFKDRVRKIRKPKNKILISVEKNNKTEKLYFNNFDNGKVIGFVESNPSTEIYKLVKELKENKKDSVES